MFDLNPLHLPDALLHQAIMVLGAAVLGYIIGYVSYQRTINQLTNELAGTGQMADDTLPASAETLPVEATPVNDPVLTRIRSRAQALDYDRIGYAGPDDADNLQVIDGIDSMVERRLHAAGIYRFKQLAQLTPDDVYLLNEIIEFFPGRIQRDNWVGQAKTLMQSR